MSLMKRDSDNGEQASSTDAASIIQEQHMLKRQILAQKFEQFKIDISIDLLKDEYLDQIENDSFVRFINNAVKNNRLRLPTNELAL